MFSLPFLLSVARSNLLENLSQTQDKLCIMPASRSLTATVAPMPK